MLAQRYTWEAEWPDGTIRAEGADLTGAVRVSLLPQVPLLPRHDVAGVGLVRRFGRGFVSALGGGVKEYVHCVVCHDCRVYVRCSTGAALVTPADYELYL